MSAITAILLVVYGWVCIVHFWRQFRSQSLGLRLCVYATASIIAYITVAAQSYATEHADAAGHEGQVDHLPVTL